MAVLTLSLNIRKGDQHPLSRASLGTLDTRRQTIQSNRIKYDLQLCSAGLIYVCMVPHVASSARATGATYLPCTLNTPIQIDFILDNGPSRVADSGLAFATVDSVWAPK